MADGSATRPTHAALIALEDEGVRWCLLRGDPLVEADGDVDVLLSARDVPAAVARLLALGWQVTERGERRVTLAHGPPAGLPPARVDLASDLRFGAIGVPVEEILDRSTTSGAVRQPDPDDEFWLLVLHSLFDHGTMRPGHAHRLSLLAEHARPDGPLVSHVFARRSAWTPARVIELARAGDWVQLGEFVDRASGTSRMLRSGCRLSRRVARRLRQVAGRARSA